METSAQRYTIQRRLAMRYLFLCTYAHLRDRGRVRVRVRERQTYRYTIRIKRELGDASGFP